MKTTKILVIASVAFALTGCHRVTLAINALLGDEVQHVDSQKTQDNQASQTDQVENASYYERTLFEAMSPDIHVDVNDWFVHDGQKIKVNQVVEEFEKEGVIHYFLLCESSKRYGDEHMMIAVISDHPHVTGESLRRGYYMFIKPYTYRTNNGWLKKTVRLFVEGLRD